MVRIVQDIDRWLGECGTTVERDDAHGTRFIAECTLPAGHDGAHDGDSAGRLVAGRITGELRDLADAVERISQHFGWGAHAVDRDLAWNPNDPSGEHVRRCCGGEGASWTGRRSGTPVPMSTLAAGRLVGSILRPSRSQIVPTY